jgi:hypothetical protein
MNLKSLSSGLLAVVLLTLTAGQCENRDVRFVLKKMPDHYRQCAAAVVHIPDGPLTQKQLLGLLVTLKKAYDGKDRCVKGAIAWSDAQVDAYNGYYK